MIKATLILLIACGVSRLLRKRSAAERHLLWVAAIAAASLIPLLSLVVPAWRPAAAGRLAGVLPGLSPAPPTQRPSLTGTSTVHAIGIEAGDGIELLLYAIWIGGSLVTLSLLVPSALALRRLVSRARPMSGSDWIGTASVLRQSLGFNRNVSLLRCDDGSLPLTWGLFRPQVLLPVDAEEWTESRRFSVLAHELAHIRRYDWLFQILAEAVCAVYWFHPLFWIARNRIHVESERACDDVVLGLGVARPDYATHLLDIARSVKRRRPAWSLSMAGRLHLESRLVAILSPETNRNAARRKAVLAVALPLLCAVVPIAAVRAPEPPLDAVPRVVRYTMPPLYSDEGRRRRVEGVVTIDARVDSSGRPRDLRIVRGLGFGLDENALLAVRNWQFAPGTRPEAVARVDVEFSLETAELNDLIANDMVTRVGPGVVPPRIVRRVEPRHPSDATERNGTVLLDAVIEDDGIPRVVRVVRSLSWEMDEAAIEALEQWRFSPAERDGEPVKVRMDVEMKFVSSNR
jgi:TonB family protein